MAFDLTALSQAVAAHGRVARVVIAAVHGSAPREVGAAMLVWQAGQSGTIGGGALEYALAHAARSQSAPRHLSRHALGPDMGQCCGGAVEVVSEVYDAETVHALTDCSVVARPARHNTGKSLAVQRVLAMARNQGQIPAPQLLDGWMIEPVQTPAPALWVWGAGHVGRALVATLSPLPDFTLAWVDTSMARFPEHRPARVTCLPTQDPARLVRHAPVDAHHLIATFSHALDLALCHHLLSHGFASAGLIGSKTKWARFQKRLAALGHRGQDIARICCPIGAPDLGKHPQAIAIGVAARLLRQRNIAFKSPGICATTPGNSPPTEDSA